MPETLHGNYQSMEHSENRVYGSRFHVLVASETKHAHKEWISFFKRLGHDEVDNPEDADYLLVFCPVKSRIKTDIDEALEIIPEGKPVILVVMHHTFNPHTIIMESRLQVTRPDVRLTVDCLFYEGRLLPCNINNIARNQIQICLGFPAPELTWWSRRTNCCINCDIDSRTNCDTNWLRRNKEVVAVGVICILVGIGLIVALSELIKW